MLIVIMSRLLKMGFFCIFCIFRESRRNGFLNREDKDNTRNAHGRGLPRPYEEETKSIQLLDEQREHVARLCSNDLESFSLRAIFFTQCGYCVPWSPLVSVLRAVLNSTIPENAPLPTVSPSLTFS